MRSKHSVLVCAMAAALAAAQSVHGQAGAQPAEAAAQERGPQAASPEALQSAIDSLGNLEFSIRMNAARTLRRAPSAARVRGHSW